MMATATSTATQNVIVDDVTAPTAPASMPDVTAECSATLTAPAANDNCAGTINSLQILQHIMHKEIIPLPGPLTMAMEIFHR
ncbi:MAG: hypothetical protein IPM10_01520 [Chitinophagaceae bacterium]|nr:hypothetical protein [Chitinophagaceae bacterium]